MSKMKKLLVILGLTLDGALTLFLFVVSVIMISRSAGLRPEDIKALPDGFINYLIKNPTTFLCAFVIPLFVLLIANIVFLVLYVKKTSKKQEVTMNDLSQDQIEELKQELLNDITKKNENK